MSFTWDQLEMIKGEQVWQHRLPPTCPTCGYNLTGLPRDRCPECGKHFDWKDVRYQAIYTWAMIERLNNANQNARTGLIISLVGWAAVGLFRLPFLRSISLAIDIIAALAALAAFILGMHVFKIRSVPKWARSYIDNPPNILLGIVTILLSLTLIAGTILLH